MWEAPFLWMYLDSHLIQSTSTCLSTSHQNATNSIQLSIKPWHVSVTYGHVQTDITHSRAFSGWLEADSVKHVEAEACCFTSQAKYCDGYVCLSVCLRADLENYTAELHQIFW